ncbi:MAG: hypothetical protein AB7H96_04285 [Vicinamibacterales bacterium]
MKRDPVLWAVGFLGVCLLGSMGYYLHDLDPIPLAAQLTFSRESFNGVLSNWSADQVQRFKHHFAVDYVFLVVYGVFGWLLARRLASQRNVIQGARLLPWLLPAAAAFDCVENLLHQVFTSHPDEMASGLYTLAGTASLVKWSLSAVFGLLSGRAWRQNAA